MKKWRQYPESLRTWNDKYAHVAQLYSRGSDISRMMSTTNPIETMHSKLNYQSLVEYI